MNTLSFSKKIILGFFLLQLQFTCNAALTFSKRPKRTVLKKLLRRYKPLILFGTGLGLGIWGTSEYYRSLFNKLQAELIKKGSQLYESNFALRKLREVHVPLSKDDVMFALENLKRKFNRATGRLKVVEKEKEEYRKQLIHLFSFMQKSKIYTNGFSIDKYLPTDFNSESGHS